mgnify:CR=1 FL=1
MMISVDLLTVAKLVDNYEKDATGATAYWPDTTHYVATVPTGKRWFVFGGIAFRGVNSTVTVAIHNDSDDVVHYIADHGAAAGIASYPESANTGALAFPLVMDAGWYVRMTFGVAQNANSYASCLVLEVDI